MTKQEVFIVYVKGVSSEVGYAFPMSVLHGIVGHELQKRACLIEVVYFRLEVIESRPFLQSLGQLATPTNKMKRYVSTAS